MPTMIRTGLTHSVCKPDCLPLDTAYEIPFTHDQMDYYSSCITSENVIHVLIGDWSEGQRKLYHYYSDNDGKDWDRELIFELTDGTEPGSSEQIDFASIDHDSDNTLYVAVLTSNSMSTNSNLRLIKGTKTGTGPYTWSWGSSTDIALGLSYYLSATMCGINVVDEDTYYVSVGGNWLFFYYSPKWWVTINGGTSWTEEPAGIDGKMLATFYRGGKLYHVKGV